MSGFFVSCAARLACALLACALLACQPSAPRAAAPQAHSARAAEPNAAEPVGCVALSVGQAPPACLDERQRAELWRTSAHLVCLVAQAPEAAQGRLPPEILERAGAMLARAGLRDPLAWAALARQHPEPILREVAALCPSAPAWALEAATSEPLARALRADALGPLDEPEAALPDEAARYLALARELGCGAQRGEPPAHRAAALRDAGLDEGAWVALGERWRDDPRVARRLWLGLAACGQR